MLSRRAFTASLLSLVICRAWAQNTAWPDRPIKIVVPLTPGGANDFLARLFAERLQPILGQPMIVENKPGASANIGTDFVAKQAPDGYTFLLSANTHVINPSFFAKLPFDPVKDFQFISLVGHIPFVLTVNAQTPVTSLREFLALARAKPGALSYGTTGIGTPHHLAGELLQTMTGISMIHVPYKGAAGIVPALLSGDITCTIAAVNSLLPHIQAGRLRALAIAGATRTSLLPGIPTMAESGPLPGFDIDGWFGVLAPAGTPRPIVDRLNTELNKIVRDPQVIKDKLTPLGIEPQGTTPEGYMEFVKSEIVKYAKIIKDANIKLEQ